MAVFSSGCSDFDGEVPRTILLLLKSDWEAGDEKQKNHNVTNTVLSIILIARKDVHRSRGLKCTKSS